MNKRLGKRLLFAALLAGSAAATQAATVWDESSHGDFSGLYDAPTALTLGLGGNVILGLTGLTPEGTDRDYFSFVVTNGAILTSLTLLDNTFVSGGVSFIGLQVGSRFTKPFDQIQPVDVLGFVHYDTSFVGVDMLPLLDGPVFNGLPSGIYTAWVQDTGGSAAGYGFDFTVSSAPVPLPGAVWLLVSGALSLGALRRRRAATAA